MKPNKKCCVCDVNESKYKCPACRLPYCSVACCKAHKEGDACKPQDAPQEEVKIQVSTVPSTFQFPTDDTIPPETLHLLSQSDQVRGLVDNPHLQTILKHLDSTKNPKVAIEEAMQEPLFAEFADACMKLVDPSEECL